MIYGPTVAKKRSMMFHRLFYINENMKKGDLLTERNYDCSSGAGPGTEILRYPARLYGLSGCHEGTALKRELVD